MINGTVSLPPTCQSRRQNCSGRDAELACPSLQDVNACVSAIREVEQVSGIGRFLHIPSFLLLLPSFCTLACATINAIRISASPASCLRDRRDKGEVVHGPCYMQATQSIGEGEGGG